MPKKGTFIERSANQGQSAGVGHSKLGPLRTKPHEAQPPLNLDEQK